MTDGGCDRSAVLGAMANALSAHACDPGCYDMFPRTDAPIVESYGVSIDATGRVVDVMDSLGAPVPEPIRTCYMQALSNQTFPCLSGENVWYECYDLLR